MSAMMAPIAIFHSNLTAMKKQTANRKTTRPISAFLVISLPQEELTELIVTSSDFRWYRLTSVSRTLACCLASLGAVLIRICLPVSDDWRNCRDSTTGPADWTTD